MGNSDLDLEEQLKNIKFLLRERQKELDCLYAISSIIESGEVELGELMQKIVEVLLAAWQYPEITCARIVFEKNEYRTQNYKETDWKLTSDLVAEGKKVGFIEVSYLEEKEAIEEGPFLPDERKLIDAISERIGRVIERKTVEAKYLQLVAIVDDTDLIVIGKTLDGIITSWNRGAEKIYGYNEDEVLGKSISLLVPQGRPDEIPGILEKIKSGIKIENFETTRVRKDGQIIDVSLTVSPVKDRGGSIVGASTIGRDITVEKRKEDEAKINIAELKKMNMAMVNRELKMVELKKEIEKLKGSALLSS